MYCKHCSHSLPDDSRFCQYCGKAVDSPASPTPTPTPQPKPIPSKPSHISAPDPRPQPAPSKPTYTAPAAKTVFCRLCGKPIDNVTKKCTGCGKQYFRGIKPMTFLCIVMALAILTLAVICIVQEFRYMERIDELEQIIAFHEAS